MIASRRIGRDLQAIGNGEGGEEGEGASEKGRPQGGAFLLEARHHRGGEGCRGRKRPKSLAIRRAGSDQGIEVEESIGSGDTACRSNCFTGNRTVMAKDHVRPKTESSRPSAQTFAQFMASLPRE